MNKKSVNHIDNERQCPVCKAKQNDSRGQILSVLNETIKSRWFYAVCGCKCGTMWDEKHDTHTCETTISNIREY